MRNYREYRIYSDRWSRFTAICCHLGLTYGVIGGKGGYITRVLMTQDDFRAYESEFYRD